MILTIVSLAVLFGFVASLGAVLKRAKSQQEARADLLDEELGSEVLPTDFGAYIEPIDLSKCLFCQEEVHEDSECRVLSSAFGGS